MQSAAGIPALRLESVWRKRNARQVPGAERDDAVKNELHQHEGGHEDQQEQWRGEVEIHQLPQSRHPLSHCL
jgi:hypothetical protein